MKTQNNRLEYIDRAKGILIILVVIGHIWQAGYVFNTIYVFHMPAFFVISGLLLHFTQSYEKGLGRFIRRRLFTFGIPFLFIEFLGIMTDIIRYGVSLNWKGYIFNTLSFHFNDHNLWFLVDLFLIEILFSVFVLIFRKRWIVCTVIAVMFFASFIPCGSNAYINTITSMCKYLPYFALGFYGRRILENRSVLGICLSVAAVLAAGIFLGTRDSAFTLRNILIMASGGLGTYFVLQVSRLKMPETLDHLLQLAGRNSIIIYGTHHIIYATVGVLIGITDYASTPIGAGIILLAAVAILEVPIIYIINRWAPFLAGKHCKKKTVQN